MSNDLVFELGCEELPSGSVLPLAQAFTEQLLARLDKAQLGYGKVHFFATPRRLGLTIYDLQTEQSSQRITRKGPAQCAAYDKQNQPTQALLGFAKSCGVGLEALTTITTDKGDWIVYEAQISGKKTQELLPVLITEVLGALPLAKSMRWGLGEIEFARPIHWAVLLYRKEVINADILGVTTSNKSYGHRFHHPQSVEIFSAESYEKKMKEAYVIADFSTRREKIIAQVHELAKTVDAEAIMPEELIDEVASIVEWPQALLANFDPSFLEVPSEALIASMQSHQKCFALKSKQGKLLPHFITIANIESKDPKQVIAGNEKVMRARLSDAAFFYQQDKKQPLSAQIPFASKVIFQARLGSLQDKALRIQNLLLQWQQALNLSQKNAERAAMLSKCDLMTGMVGEFPELQGVMGYYYALHDQEEEEVALALNEQYMPKFSGDRLPQTSLGLALSLADRMDTLAGIFAIGQKPTGVKDPFKLRRHALAVVRLLLVTPAKLQLSTLIQEALSGYHGRFEISDTLFSEIKYFILERLQSYYQKEFSLELIQAVRACQDEWLFDFDQRISALKIFAALPEAQALSAACKRVGNILATAGHRERTISEGLLQEKEEKALYQKLQELEKDLASRYAASDYLSILNKLAGLRKPVDDFFDKVMVMVEDKNLKHNRLSLLARLHTLLQGVADISLLSLPTTQTQPL